ncbi:cystatin-A-like [Pecten maximus]|uniref:cystatin-A-like n=1 Tax=Pecten maximus TaxID=6579 RepID=UPI0014588265|nr:cystatin-A-like [Pecten maximus]
MLRIRAKQTGSLLFFISVLIYFCEGSRMMVGGVGEVKAADEEVQQIANDLKAEVEKESNQKYEIFNAINYKTQVVAGTNYFIKVDVGDGTYIHLRVFKSLPHAGPSVELVGYQENKSKDDPINHF